MVRNKGLILGIVFLLVMACNLPSPAVDGATPLANAPIPLADAPTVPVEATAIVTAPTQGAVEIVPVPVTEIQINGASYLSYQMPGDPFRFVCQQPCKGAPEVIFGQYAGFRRARESLLQLTGIDTLPELQPVDVHLSSDSKCGNFDASSALSFAYYDLPGNAYTCNFVFDYRGVNGQSYTAEEASQIFEQTILVHEYLHTIFFGRVPSEVDAMHDFVTPIGQYVGSQWQGDAELCANHPSTPPGDFGGNLMWELCRQNGFTLAAWKASLIELDALYQAGSGQLQMGFSHPSPSMSQYREILNRVLGSDTRQAFADACWPAALFADSYTLSDACLYPTPTVAPTPVK